jgi:hypothetical protein
MVVGDLEEEPMQICINTPPPLKINIPPFKLFEGGVLTQVLRIKL